MKTACANPSLSTYAVIKAGRAIQFSPCGVVSYHVEDVRYRYCALCHAFIEKESPATEAAGPNAPSLRDRLSSWLRG